MIMCCENLRIVKKGKAKQRAHGIHVSHNLLECTLDTLVHVSSVLFNLVFLLFLLLGEQQLLLYSEESKKDGSTLRSTRFRTLGSVALN